MNSNDLPRHDINTLLALQRQLARNTRAEVRFDPGTRAAYASEASNYRQVPIGIVVPRSVEDVVETMRACREADLPVLTRGAGTSMCGQSVNAAVIIDASKYLNTIEAIDVSALVATVQPGVICDQLKDAAALKGLTFGPDPATHSRCTLGGMIGNNSCGAHSVMAGKTAENIEALEVLTYDGERFWVGPTDDAALREHLAAGGRRAEIVSGLLGLVEKYGDAIREGFPRLKRRVSGYSLDQLLPENGFNIARALVGSEGTCVSVLRAKTTLMTNPVHRLLVVFGFPTIFDAADCVPQLLPLSPIAMEGLDTGIVGGLRERGLALADIAELPEGNAWLMVEFGATDKAVAMAAAQRAAALAPDLPGLPSVRLVSDAGLMKRLWSVRETGASATSIGDDMSKPDPVVGWEDAAVEPRHLGPYLREFSALVESYGYKTNMYGHFGDGCIHSRITFDLRNAQGVNTWREFLFDAAKLVVKYEGSLSGEHGDGQAKGELLHLMYSPELMEAFRAFKAIWDPRGRMNPGKLLDAMPVDQNLRLGPTYKRVDVSSPFLFGDLAKPDTFARATERCIGMGKCRSLSGGTMCPSYRASREEKYSTRGRARLLFELLKGEVIEDGWQSEAVKDSLDHCLACKGCRSDCPTHVDIAKYKSHFLYEYHRHKRRHVIDAIVSRIGNWLPVATHVSGVANALIRNPSFRKVSAKLGFAEDVKFPTIAAKTFRNGASAKRLLARAEAVTTRCTPVLLWTDTFNNGFTPEVMEAAVRVLESKGFEVRLLRKQVCCGRPMYDAGLLDEAKRNLETIMSEMANVIESKLPVVVLEPSCLSVFRDELVALFPNDDRAHALGRAVKTLAELLQEYGVTLPKLDEEVHLHGHCHQKACGGMKAETAMLKQATSRGSVLPTGCCGMAGAFGYHRKTADLAKQVALSELVPVISALRDDAVIVSDGFSCRSQIRNTTGRTALHLAQWLDRQPDAAQTDAWAAAPVKEQVASN
ncbi:dimethylmenaquinone methyltransferase [Burkholderia sp. MSMB1459WGS]|uniref:FAD-binding and (Fe-S)-binding domain-containing protein n=1 Tax=Burkholderia sp. MSMB1459WGS TaxID=1637970 RepID=UPI00075FA112|nr:FAD-binding and (Fe-S)-binding domain-containing protein [Burkholderia sp. MSMB1459WGS]KWO42469.1 dimethylmenaquinone methyltransferase [Burkholderia sp. MSMB1459WGS]